MMRNSRKVLSIGLGVLVGALVTGCAVAPSTGAGAASPQPTSRGAASSGAAGSSFGDGSDPVTPASAGAEPAIGGSDDSTGSTSGAGVGAARPTGDDASVSSDDAVGGSATTQAHGVDGNVSDQEGKPVTGALVTPTSLDTPSKAIPEVAVFTNDEGRYSWVLPAGRYRITVTADGYQEASVETLVPEGGTATLDLQLRRA
ncbi:MAG TPA: carboxypeptidase-like regulatory domain-containing protein [Mycobacterium sp.]